MTKTWLLIDCSYLCHRAWHTTGTLSFKGKDTGVAFGFFRDLCTMRVQFPMGHPIFCWDMAPYLRSDIRTEYKSGRSNDEHLGNLMKEIRRDYLFELGYSNVWWQPGFEADDMIAQACFDLEGDKVIVSNDQDLYQLLSSDVSIWKPSKKELYRVSDLFREYGVRPEQWARVKAMAGCVGDGVDGIKGVGEKTACKYITGQLNSKTKAYRALTSSEGEHITERNLRLVKLPFKDSPSFELDTDRTSETKWQRLCKELGMTSLRNQLPVGVARCERT